MAVPKALCTLLLTAMIGSSVAARTITFDWSAFALVDCWMGAPAAPDPSKTDLWSSEVWCYNRIIRDSLGSREPDSKVFGSYLWQSSLKARCYPVADDSSRVLLSDDYLPYQRVVRQLVNWENPATRPAFGGCRNRVRKNIPPDGEQFPTGTLAGWIAIEDPKPGVSFRCYRNGAANNIDFEDGTVCSLMYYCHNAVVISADPFG